MRRPVRLAAVTELGLKAAALRQSGVMRAAQVPKGDPDYMCSIKEIGPVLSAG